MDKKSKDGFAIAGFVMGIVAFVPFLVFLGIPGIVFSALGLKSEKRGLAIAGLILSISALVLVLLALILVGIVWGSVNSVVTNPAFNISYYP